MIRDVQPGPKGSWTLTDRTGAGRRVRVVFDRGDPKDVDLFQPATIR